MRALAADGVAAALDASDEDWIVADPSSDEPALRDEGGRNTDPEIGPFRTLGISAHGTPSRTIGETMRCGGDGRHMCEIRRERGQRISMSENG
jgi:hypothetical protein